MLVYQRVNYWMGVRTNLQLEGICPHAPHHHHRQGAEGIRSNKFIVKPLKSHYIPLAPLFLLVKSAENHPKQHMSLLVPAGLVGPIFPFVATAPVAVAAASAAAAAPVIFATWEDPKLGSELMWVRQ